MGRLVVFAVCLLLAAAAKAHEVRPAYLELRETVPDTYDVLWKVPARGVDERLGIYVRFPSDVETVGETRGLFVSGAFVERSRVRREGGLAGQRIEIDGLVATGTDVLVRVERADGSTQLGRVLPSRPSFLVDVDVKRWNVASTYLFLGVEHIWGGIDHLLFVTALLLLVKGTRRVVATITAFTVAHSITLCAATLGWIGVPAPPVEAVIALSIVFVAGEIVRARTGHTGWAERWPWLVSFTFGLLHGFGFAGALHEVGLPHDAIPVALLFFNVGVEVGQLLFIAVVVLATGMFGRLDKRGRIPRPSWAWRVAPYGIGTVAAFWTIQRIAGF